MYSIHMVPGYLRNAASSALVTHQSLAVAQDAATLLVLDGGLGFGQVMAHDAMAAGIEQARTQGHCLVMLRNSHHIGRVVVAPDRIERAAAFGTEVERVLTWVTSENQTGPGKIKLPGEPELATRETRLAQGIPVDRTTWEQIRHAAGLGLDEAGWPA